MKISRHLTLEVPQIDYLPPSGNKVPPPRYQFSPIYLPKYLETIKLCCYSTVYILVSRIRQLAMHIVDAYDSRIDKCESNYNHYGPARELKQSSCIIAAQQIKKFFQTIKLMLYRLILQYFPYIRQLFLKGCANTLLAFKLLRNSFSFHPLRLCFDSFCSAYTPVLTIRRSVITYQLLLMNILLTRKNKTDIMSRVTNQYRYLPSFLQIFHKNTQAIIHDPKHIF